MASDIGIRNGGINRNGVRRALCLLGILCAAAVTLPSQVLTTLYNFDGGTAGAAPLEPLVQGLDGNLYGSTGHYGTGDGGALFKITPEGTLTALHDFCLQSGCADGSGPSSALIQAPNGNFFGTTYRGGAHSTKIAGTIFQLTPKGTVTTVYSFCAFPVSSNCLDGKSPVSVLQTWNGELYGVTNSGGKYLKGTIFKATTNGLFKKLHDFCSTADCPDGAYPNSALIQASDGSVYGTTSSGGLLCGIYAGGTVFKIDPSGVFSTVYAFGSLPGCADGRSPDGLVQGTDGNFYGTTLVGGPQGIGSIFRLTPEGSLTNLYNFGTQSSDGSTPNSGLIQATDGNFYGTTQYSNDSDGGTIFSITPDGAFSTLYSFCASCPNGGRGPEAGLIQDTNGDFYGTTGAGGTIGYGTLFRFSTGLGPFVETQKSAGQVQSLVEILGTNLTGATAVKFNGVPATFTVTSNSLIVARVPTGATSGTIQVVTPTGTLSSNVPFQVLP